MGLEIDLDSDTKNNPDNDNPAVLLSLERKRGFDAGEKAEAANERPNVELQKANTNYQQSGTLILRDRDLHDLRFQRHDRT